MTAFTGKIDDFKSWVELAFEYFVSERYADSLTNLRKSGESFCKILIYYKYSEKIADGKIEKKSYKELMELLLSEQLAPRKVINLLEVFQIYGNIATHDNAVIKDYAEYGIIALKLLTAWLYEDHLHILIPASVKKYFTVVAGTQPKSPPAEKASAKHLKEKQELAGVIAQLKGDIEKKEEFQKKLQDQVDNSSKTIDHLENALQLKNKEIKLLETEVRQSAAQPRAVEQQPTKNKFPLKLNILIPLLIILLVISFIVGFYTSSVHSDQKEQSVMTTDTFIDRNSLHIIIFPFKVLKDNPSVSLNIEEILSNFFKQKKENTDQNFEVLIYGSTQGEIYTWENARKIAKEKNAHFVFFGEIYESARWDSIEINCKYAFAEDDRIHFIINKTISKPTDSVGMEFMREIEENTVIQIAFYYLAVKREFQKALSYLKGIVPSSVFQQWNYFFCKAICYENLNDLDAAIREIDSALQYFPNDATLLAFKGKMLAFSNRMEESVIFCRRALAIDSANPEYLVTYANVLITKPIHAYERAAMIVAEVLNKDTSNFDAWYVLAWAEREMKHYRNAEQYFLKAIRINRFNIKARKSYADLLCEEMGKGEEAVVQLEEILKIDSADGEAHYLLSSLYSLGVLKDIKKAEYHLHKSKHYLAKKSSYSFYSTGLTASAKGNTKNAEDNFLKAYLTDTNNLALNAQLGIFYMERQRYEESKKFLYKAYRIDSLHPLINTQLGVFYMEKENKRYFDPDKAISFFYQAYQYNNYDTLALYNLIQLYYMKSNYEMAKQCAQTFLRVKPENFKVLSWLASIYNLEKKNNLAVRYWEKALKINPKEFNALLGLAIIYSRDGHHDRSSVLYYANKAAEVGAEVGEYHVRLSEIFLACGKKYEAEQHYFTAIALDPTQKSESFEKMLGLNIPN